jgi:hypothetical protein
MPATKTLNTPIAAARTISEDNTQAGARGARTLQGIILNSSGRPRSGSAMRAGSESPFVRALARSAPRAGDVVMPVHAAI